MRAAKLTDKQRIEVVECPDPPVGADEVLVRVQAVAICPSDVRLFLQGHAGGVRLERPLTPGHEFSGVVEKIGEQVRGVAVGDRVAVEPSWHCGACELCARGLLNLCENIRFPSFPPTDGALAELIACPGQSVRQLPNGFSFVEGALLEPLAVAIHAIRLAELSTDETVAVLGAGVIGLGVLQAVRAYGLRTVYVAEPRAERRRVAKVLGAELVRGSAAELKTAGARPLIVFEAAGSVEAVQQATQLVAPGGRVVVIGIPQEEEFVFEAPSARRKELTMLFVRRSREALDEALRLVQSGDVSFAEYPTLTLPLSEAQAALELSARGMGEYLRIIVQPQER